jgi:rhodanese-related sulfurtransferase
MDHSPRFVKIVEEVKQNVEETTPEEVHARRSQGESLVVIDVREDHEWETGHVAGAIHLGKGIIERDIEKTVPDPETEVILYCGGGFRSALAADALDRMGYTRVKSMAGGWKAWQQQGLPVEQ